MSIRSITLIALLWVCSLLAVASVVRGQSYGVNPLPPRVLSGPDFGIRIEGEQNGHPVGVPVIRIKDQWVEIKFSAGKTNLLR